MRTLTHHRQVVHRVQHTMQHTMPRHFATSVSGNWTARTSFEGSTV